MDMASGKTTTVFEGLVINTGSRFNLVAVKGNQVLNRVRVEHNAVFGGEKVTVGDSLLIGTITMVESGPVATKAWPFRSSAAGNGGFGAKQRPPAPVPPGRLPTPVPFRGSIHQGSSLRYWKTAPATATSPTFRSSKAVRG
jgi:hypothetical protein